MSASHNDGPDAADRARNPNLDPEPAQDPDLESGGGVVPGSTPPDSNSATASPSPESGRRFLSAPTILIGLIAVVVLIGLVFLAYGLGLGG